MKSHVWRPLYVALVVVAVVLAARFVLVPDDFGIQEQGYMYGWHRKGNENEWKAVEVKYRTAAYCRECHADPATRLSRSPHGIITCENCHGPALGHPEDPPTLTTDRNRKLCLRCHVRLSYPGSGRSDIRGINPDAHHPEAECVLCHDPHDPVRKEVRL